MTVTHCLMHTYALVRERAQKERAEQQKTNQRILSRNISLITYTQNLSARIFSNTTTADGRKNVPCLLITYSLHFLKYT